MKNRRIGVTQPGGPDVLHLIEEDIPGPKANQVRVKVLAAGVAYADIGEPTQGKISVQVGCRLGTMLSVLWISQGLQLGTGQSVSVSRH